VPPPFFSYLLPATGYQLSEARTAAPGGWRDFDGMGEARIEAGLKQWKVEGECDSLLQLESRPRLLERSGGKRECSTDRDGG
jgi:hypothetical protein